MGHFKTVRDSPAQVLHNGLIHMSLQRLKKE